MWLAPAVGVLWFIALWVGSPSGHRDKRMLLRYTHLRSEDLVAKLDANP